jgi:hypothetical protein
MVAQELTLGAVEIEPLLSASMPEKVDRKDIGCKKDQ